MPQYVVLFTAGAGAANPWPDAPTSEITVTSLDAAVRLFRRMIHGPCVNSGSTDEGGPWADINLAENWDDTSYGDGHLYRLTVGPRGGIVRESW